MTTTNASRGTGTGRLKANAARSRRDLVTTRQMAKHLGIHCGTLQQMAQHHGLLGNRGRRRQITPRAEAAGLGCNLRNGAGTRRADPRWYLEAAPELGQMFGLDAIRAALEGMVDDVAGIQWLLNRHWYLSNVSIALLVGVTIPRVFRARRKHPKRGMTTEMKFVRAAQQAERLLGLDVPLPSHGETWL